MGGTLTEVKRGIPDGLQPPTSDDSGGLSGGEVAAIVVVLLIVVAMGVVVVVGIVAMMQRRRKRFELRTAGDNYPSIDGTYQTDTFAKGDHGEKARSESGTFPLKPSAHSYSPVPATDTTVENEGAISDKGEGAMREEEEEEGGDSDVMEKDPLGESSKDTHL